MFISGLLILLIKIFQLLYVRVLWAQSACIRVFYYRYLFLVILLTVYAFIYVYSLYEWYSR